MKATDSATRVYAGHVTHERVRPSAAWPALFACAVFVAFGVAFGVAGCGDDYGLAVETTVVFDSSVMDQTLAKVVSIVFSASGDDTYTHDVMLSGATRTERFVYKPSTGANVVNLAVTAEDQTGSPLAYGTSRVFMLTPGKTSHVTITLSAIAPPAAAAAVGYDTLTFNSTTLGTTPGTWQGFDFYSYTQPAGSAVQNPDGSLGLPGVVASSFVATVATAALNKAKPQLFQGIAFGGGGYFEATLSFTGTPDGKNTSPSFWASDIEHATGYQPQSQGQSWIQLDILSTDQASDTKFNVALRNYYYNAGARADVNQSTVIAGDPVTVPNGATLNSSHTYAMLWVPATSTTPGTMKWFCDGIAVGGVATWDKYSPTETFPPAGANIGNVIDALHLFLILSVGSPTYAAEVTSVRVWQASTGGNLTF